MRGEPEYLNIKDPEVRLDLYRRLLGWFTAGDPVTKYGLCATFLEHQIYKGSIRAWTRDIDPKDDLPEMEERRTRPLPSAYLWYTTDERVDALTDAIKEMEELKEKGKLI